MLNATSEQNTAAVELVDVGSGFIVMTIVSATPTHPAPEVGVMV